MVAGAASRAVLQAMPGVSAHDIIGGGGRLDENRLDESRLSSGRSMRGMTFEP